MELDDDDDVDEEAERIIDGIAFGMNDGNKIVYFLFIKTSHVLITIGSGAIALGHE